VIDMFPVPEAAVRRVVADAGGTVVRAAPDFMAGPVYESREYFVARNP
jgi:hypothetical protein